MTHMYTKPLQALCEIDVLASSAYFWQFEDERPVQPVKINSFSEIRELVSQHLLISGTQREWYKVDSLSTDDSGPRNHLQVSARDPRAVQASWLSWTITDPGEL